MPGESPAVFGDALRRLAGTRLRMELDRVPLWRGNHVEISQLIQDFARYLYLPRITHPSVLIQAVRDGVSLLMWNPDTFACADAYDETMERYQGLRCGQPILLPEGSLTGLLVKPEIAVQQREKETENEGDVGTGGGEQGGGEQEELPERDTSPKRFHGSISLDAKRVGRDAGQIAEEIISHLAGIVGSKVTVTLEIEANIPDGADEKIVRTVTENCRTLKFTSAGFEKE